MEIVKFIAALIAFGGVSYLLYHIRKQYYISLLGDDYDIVALGSVTTKIFINMAVNLAIFLLGAIVSYIFHDPIPMYQETYFKMQKYLKTIKRGHDSLIKELDLIESRNPLKKTD
jgi:hypothetical protein